MSLLCSKRRVVAAGMLTALGLYGCRAILDIHEPPADAEGEEETGARVDAAVGPLPAVPSCAGPSVPLEAWGTASYATAKFDRPLGEGDTDGALVVDLLYSSAVNPAAFPAEAAPDITCEPDPPEATTRCTASRITIGSHSWQNVEMGYYSELVETASPREVGGIGNDIVAMLGLTTIAPAYGKLFIAEDTESPCSKSQLVTAGFIALSTDGYYARDRGTLRRFSEVKAGAEGSFPNTPTLPTRIAGTSALATLDTGRNDQRAPGIIVNAPLLAALEAGHHVSRVPDRDVAIPVCVSAEKYTYDAYALDAASALELVGEGESATAHFPSPITLFALKPGVAFTSDICQQEQVETWTVPAARLQGSFVSAIGVLVVDAAHSRVWVPRR